MKLKEFLKKFEGLDPELELYYLFSRNLYSDTLVKLDDNNIFPYISYVEQLNRVVSAYTDQKGIPVLIISN